MQQTEGEAERSTAAAAALRSTTIKTGGGTAPGRGGGRVMNVHCWRAPTSVQPLPTPLHPLKPRPYLHPLWLPYLFGFHLRAFFFFLRRKERWRWRKVKDGGRRWRRVWGGRGGESQGGGEEDEHLPIHLPILPPPSGPPPSPSPLQLFFGGFL